MNLIQRDCISDHINHIKSYVQNSSSHKLLSSYNDGMKRHNEVKIVMRDLMLHHPQLMSFLLNPQDSNICSDKICSNMQQEAIQYNISNKDQSGGYIDYNDIVKILERAKTLFETLKNTDIDRIKEIKDRYLLL